MNWHHWYWWTWPAGIAIGVTVICAFNWVMHEIGLRRTTAYLNERRAGAEASAKMRHSMTYAGGGGTCTISRHNHGPDVPCPDDRPSLCINPNGGRSWVERHDHRASEPCGVFCPGNPSKLGGNGGPTLGDVINRLHYDTPVTPPGGGAESTETGEQTK